MSRCRSRGIALPTVLLVLVLLETLVMVAYIGALAWARTARWSAAEAGTRAAREAGLARAQQAPWLAVWDTASRRVPLESGRLPGGSVFATSLVHLGPRVTVTISEGTSERSDARAIAAQLGVRRPVLPRVDAALITGGGIDVEGALLTVGQPSDDDEWAACGSPRAAAAHLQLSSAEASALFDSLPHLTWRPFALSGPAPAGGVITPGPVESGGVCAGAIWSNWGDPLAPLSACGAHYATVYYDGALRIAGGRGQGALVVMGDLIVGETFVFHGLVAVRGQLVVEQDASFTVVGTLLVGGVLGQRHAVRGTLAVQYSKCLLEMGLPASGAADHLPGPSWLELSEVP